MSNTESADGGNFRTREFIAGIRGLQAGAEFRRFLHDYNVKLPLSYLNWEKAINDLISEGTLIPSELEAYFTTLRSYSKRYVRIVNLESFKRSTLKRQCESQQITILPTKIAKLLPYPTLKPELLSLLIQQHYEVSKHCDENGCLISLTSARTFKQRQELNREYLGDDVPAYILDAESITYQTDVPVQVFDWIYVDYKKKTALIAMDSPLDTLDTKVDGILDNLQTALCVQLGFTGSLSPKNLHPAMNSIYYEPQEGTVVELLFVCSTGFNRSERLRRNKLIDLRKEIYHEQGLTALTANNGAITVHGLSVKWFLDGSELSIKGSRRGNSQRDVIHHASLPQFCSEESFMHAISRLEHHLP